MNNHELSKSDLDACRAFYRLLDVHTEGWDKWWQADRHWDGGEWSDAAWSDNWQDAEEHCERVIAERFNLPSAGYVMNLIQVYDNEHCYREWLAQYVKHHVWGSADPDRHDAVEVAVFTDRRKAAALVDRLNNDPQTHPDVSYWFETVDERPFASDNYGEDLS